MKFALTLVLVLTLAVGTGLILAGTSGESHASPPPAVTSVFGVKEAPAGDLLVHIRVFVPSGVDSQAAAEAALAAQQARPATPRDLSSADFVTSGLVWDQFSDADPGNNFVTQNYNVSGEPSGIDGQLALTNTHSTWNAVPASSFVFSFGGLTNRCPSLVDECSGPQTFDGFNDVQFMNLAGPCNAIFGCTLGVTWYSTSIDEADVALNTKVSWVHDCSSTGPATEAETVILHENGHVLGLGHSEVSAAVMAAFYDGAQCQLHQDDADGVSALYPADGATATPTPSPSPTPVPTATPAPTPTPTASPTPAPTPTPSGFAAVVDDVSYTTSGGRSQDAHLTVAVSVTADGQPVDGASVSADIYLDNSFHTSRSGTTGTNGTVDLKVNNAPPGCYVTVVTSVSASGLSWDGVTPANGFAKGGAVC